MVKKMEDQKNKIDELKKEIQMMNDNSSTLKKRGVDIDIDILHSKKQELESKLILAEKWCKAYEYTITKLSGEKVQSFRSRIKEKIIDNNRSSFSKDDDPRSSFIGRPSYEDACKLFMNNFLAIILRQIDHC